MRADKAQLMPINHESESVSYFSSMRPTEILIDEHEVILNGLHILDGVANELEAGGSVDTSALSRLLEFFRRFAEESHPAKEEGILFPELSRVGLPIAFGPVAALIAEHVKSGGILAVMEQSCFNLDDRRRRDDFCAAARNYILKVRHHIRKENDALFLWADQRLSASQQRSIRDAFRSVGNDLSYWKHIIIDAGLTLRPPLIGASRL